MREEREGKRTEREGKKENGEREGKKERCEREVITLTQSSLRLDGAPQIRASSCALFPLCFTMFIYTTCPP